MIEALIKQYLRLILDISGGLRMWRVLRFDNKKCNLSKSNSSYRGRGQELDQICALQWPAAHAICFAANWTEPSVKGFAGNNSGSFWQENGKIGRCEIDDSRSPLAWCDHDYYHCNWMGFMETATIDTFPQTFREYRKFWRHFTEIRKTCFGLIPPWNHLS